HWQAWEIDFLEKLAVHVGVGIQQADLYLQLSTELKERRQTEIQLLTTVQELEQQKFALDEAAMVTRLDDKGIITYVNSKFCQVSQYSRAEIIGKPYQAAVGIEQAPEFLQSIRDHVMNGRVWHGEVENRAKDGSIYWTDTTVVPLLNSAGKPVEYLTIRFDITERKIFQEQLRAIQNRLQYLLASSPAVIYTRRPETLTTIVFISPNIRHLLGWTSVQFTHNTDTWVSLIHPDDRQPVLTNLTKLTSTHHLVLEYRLQHENGSYCWIRDEMRMITNDQGQPLECIGSMIDVTDRHVAEEQVLKALEQERELNNLKTRFVCNTSHEFRTPLATIFAASDLLKRFGHKLSEEKKQERLDKIQAEVKHMTRLLEDVLLLGKVSEGRYRFKPVLTNLATFCRDLLQEAELLVGQTHTFELQCQGDAFSILADPALLKQLVNNLLSNAVKYSPQGGAVTLRLIHKTDHIVLQVADQGIGIAQSDIEHLFEDFFRAGNVGNLPGTGLGLAIVKQAVDLHGGTIAVESELGQGTTVTVCLPTGL
ncbi:MAG: PAS domain-containing sensor histidine kinase, partial [Cyanobacteria bacterium]|nr:PAS domain-containing sensor histidine kinase [Cyanobacteriota bacterium]MDW8201577.1 PAS domain-containing sensor histidine kinase [Cyanobacteriota bacterium SKYGB_h_bin112]